MESDNLKELVEFAKTLKILFIEDNDEVRLQIYKLLENFFSHIDIAIDGVDANEKYNDFYTKNGYFYDIVISDLNLPKRDGTEVCRLIIDKNPKQMILIISAYTEPERLLKLIEIGIYKFLQKPLDYLNFLDVIKKTLLKIKEDKNVLKLKNELRKIQNTNTQLEELIKIDKLTELFNRNYIDEFLENKLKDLNINEKISIIFIDIDDFKKINDTHGHLVGDIILKEFATILVNNVRMEDVVGRWGGEEFIIICQNSDIRTAVQVAQKLRALIQDSSSFIRNIKLTASFGVTTYENEPDINSLIQKADDNLYKSKASGKNKVTYLQI